MSKYAFYVLLEESAEFLRTSQPSPEDFVCTFEEAKSRGDELICILLSSGLSGPDRARRWRRICRTTRAFIFWIRSMPPAASKFLRTTRSISSPGSVRTGNRPRLETLSEWIRLYAALDTLEYPAKSDRLNRTVASIGSVLHLKPIISFREDDPLTLADKSIGKVRTMHSMLDRLSARPLNPAFPLYTVFSNGKENVPLLEKRMIERSFTPWCACASARESVRISFPTRSASSM